MDRFDKLAIVSFVLASITFIAAGNPHIDQEQKQNSELRKMEIEAPEGTDVASMSGIWTQNQVTQVACTDNVVRHHGTHFVKGMVTNSSGHCYYTETWKTQLDQLSFYGLQLFTIESGTVEAGSDRKEEARWTVLNPKKAREYLDNRGESQ